MTYIPIQLAIW